MMMKHAQFRETLRPLPLAAFKHPESRREQQQKVMASLASRLEEREGPAEFLPQSTTDDVDEDDVHAVGLPTRVGKGFAGLDFGDDTDEEDQEGEDTDASPNNVADVEDTDDDVGEIDTRICEAANDKSQRGDPHTKIA